MTRSVLTVDLKNDAGIVEAYRAYHQDVWPEVLASLRRAGVEAMDIFILDRRLVMVVQTGGRGIRECFASHVASSPRVAEWEALMQSMLEPPPGAPPDTWWTAMEPIFRLRGDRTEAPADLPVL
jgi:L-rhamnose mutarotase